MTSKTVKDLELPMNEMRLNPLSLEEAKSVLVSRVYDQNVLRKLSKTDEIAELCGFVPLALRIIGSLLSDYSEEELIKRLKEPSSRVPETDQLPVEKAIKTSFDLLTEDERHALVLMSVFPGSFDSYAAEVILRACKSYEGPPISILDSLKHRSLVEQPSPQRYQLHSLIKTFAEKVDRSEAALVLEEGEKEACVHYMSRLATDADCYWGKDTCKKSLDSFNEDRHNFEHFLCVFIQWRESEGDMAMKSCEAFFVNLPQKCMYLEICVLPTFYTDFLQKLHEAKNSELPPVNKVEILCLLGHEMRKKGNKEKYGNLMKKADELYKETKFNMSPLSKVIYLNSRDRFTIDERFTIGESSSEPKGMYVEALELCEKELPNHPEYVATILYTGTSAKRQKNHTEYKEKLNQALALSETILGKHAMTARCYKAIAELKKKEEPFPGALSFYEKCLEMYKDLGMEGCKETIHILKNYGYYLKINGKDKEAGEIFEKANRIAERDLDKNHRWTAMVKTMQNN